MKVLWFVNVPLPEMIGNKIGEHSGSGGWMIALLEQLRHSPDIEIAVACVKPGLTQNVIELAENVKYYSISQGPARRIFAFRDLDNDPRYLKSV